MAHVPRAMLVGEDDPDLRDALRERLARRGFTVSTARNGREAIRKLKAAPIKPVAIVLDLHLPIMDSFAFREEQVQDPSLSHIPVVVMSAERDLLETAAGLMPVAVVEKPVGPDEVVEVVLAIGRRRAPDVPGDRVEERAALEGLLEHEPDVR